MSTKQERGVVLCRKIGGWEIPYKAQSVLCADGKRRAVRLNQSPDTYFSHPGRASFNGKTIRGYVTSFENENGDRDLFFARFQTEDYKLIP